MNPKHEVPEQLKEISQTLKRVENSITRDTRAEYASKFMSSMLTRITVDSSHPGWNQLIAKTAVDLADALIEELRK